jgi:site-specific DNA recombinase
MGGSASKRQALAWARLGIQNRPFCLSMSMKKYIIYARKSTESEDRQVLSIDSQINELKEIAKRRGFEIAEILKESKSAKAPGRPIFNALMDRAESGEVAGILCWKLDRLARNPVDGGRIIWSIKQQGLTIVTPAQTYSREDDNVILMYVEFGMAQKYIDDLGKGVKRGNRAKLEMGWLPGPAPIGFLNKLDDHTLIPDPERFPLIRKMWELYMGGTSVSEIINTADKEWGLKTIKRKRMGGLPISKSQFYRMLVSPFYYGQLERMDYGEKRQYQGKHKPIVSKEEFWKVQRMLGRPAPRPQEKRHFAFTGMIRCGECGCSITAEEKIKKSGRAYTYYRCSRRHKTITCKNPPVTLPELEKQVAPILEEITIPDAFKEWALGWLRRGHEFESDNREVVLSTLQNTYAENERKLDRLTDMRLKEMLTDEEYTSKKAALTGEQKNLKEKIGDADQHAQNWRERMEWAFDYATAAKKRFESPDLEERRKVLYELGTNLILQNKELRLELNETLSLFAKYSKQLFSDVERLELDKNGHIQEGTNAFQQLVPTWRVGWDLNPR